MITSVDDFLCRYERERRAALSPEDRLEEDTRRIAAAIVRGRVRKTLDAVRRKQHG